MRMVVMFDLPVETREQRKIATKFRKYLLDEGYVMMQFSVYYRICNGKDMVNKYLLRLEDNVPEKLNCNIKCIKNFKNLYRQRITQ